MRICASGVRLKLTWAVSIFSVLIHCGKLCFVRNINNELFHEYSFGKLLEDLEFVM